MKIPFLITIAGLVIGFAVPAFAQQKETVDPQLAEQLGALSKKSGEAFNSNGPVTVTRDLIIRPEDREEFLALVKEYRLIFLRNGAFLFRVGASKARGMVFSFAS